MATTERPRLYYWKGRGRAEMIRLTCAAAGIEFDETDLKARDEFLKLIDDGMLLYKQLPLFEIDGLKLVGSEAIVRYLGRKAGLYGNTNTEQTRIDIFMMGAKDFLEPLLGYLFVSSAEEQLEKKVLPAANNKYLPGFEKSLGENGTGFLVGDRLTVADIVLFDALTHIKDAPFDKLTAVLQNYPKCTAFLDLMASQPGIKEYLVSPKRNPVPTAEYINDVCTTLGWK